MEDVKSQLEATIQARVDSDTEFQSSIKDLSDEEKSQKLDERKSEEFNKELLTLKEGSEKAIKTQELADNYKTRAEKAEKLLENKGGVKEDGLSNTDILYLAKADIHEDDLQDVLDWSKFKKISVKEAHNALKETLKVREEQRRTTAATQTGRGSRSQTNNTGETFLKKADAGELPESEQEIQNLAEARIHARTKK